MDNAIVAYYQARQDGNSVSTALHVSTTGAPNLGDTWGYAATEESVTFASYLEDGYTVDAH